MASLQEYCKKLSDEQLIEAINDYIDSGDPVLMDMALDILGILVERHPSQTDVHAAWRDFQKHYMPKENDL